MNDEETYRFQERIAISCEGKEPDDYVLSLAKGDVERFRREMKESNYE